MRLHNIFDSCFPMKFRVAWETDQWTTLIMPTNPIKKLMESSERGDKIQIIQIQIRQDCYGLISVVSNQLLPWAISHLTRICADNFSNKEQTQIQMPVSLGPMTSIYQQTSLWWTGGNAGGYHMSKDRAHASSEGGECFSDSTELPWKNLDSDLIF